MAMSFDTNVHVLGLNPKEQFLIRILMANLMAGFIDKMIIEAPSVKNGDILEQRSRGVVRMFIQYNDFIDMLCPESMLGKAKAKVLMIKPQMMKYIVSAFNGYDPNNNYITADHRNLLNPSFESLKQKVYESYKYTYDKREIDKAKGER